jgi:hypothetical protein
MMAATLLTAAGSNTGYAFNTCNENAFEDEDQCWYYSVFCSEISPEQCIVNLDDITEAQAVGVCNFLFTGAQCDAYAETADLVEGCWACNILH